jgi:hypothetical protein
MKALLRTHSLKSSHSCRSAFHPRRAERNLAADGAIACFSGNIFPSSVNTDGAPQLKAISVRRRKEVVRRCMCRYPRPNQQKSTSRVILLPSRTRNNGMTRRLWLLSCEELPSKSQGCGGQASSDSGAIITSTPVVTKATPLSLRLPCGEVSWLFTSRRASKVETSCWPSWESTRLGRYVSTSGAPDSPSASR